MESVSKQQISKQLEQTRSQNQASGENVRQDAQHLVKWVLFTTSTFQLNLSYNSMKKLNKHVTQQQLTSYTTSQIYHSKYLPYILHQICQQQFSIHMSTSQMEDHFIEYFFKQFGFYVSPLLSTSTQKQKVFISLVLYACIYSPQKQSFVEKIILLNSQTQQKIIAQIEQVQRKLKQTCSWNRMIQQIKRLQQLNQEYRNLIRNLQEHQEVLKNKIVYLQKQLQQTNKERNQFYVQKKMLVNRFKLSNLAEFEQLWSQLQRQSQSRFKRQLKLMCTIDSLQSEISLLNKQLQNSDQIILQINTQCHQLQKSYYELNQQVTFYKESSILPTQSKLIFEKDPAQFDQVKEQQQIKSNSRRNNQTMSLNKFSETNSSFGSNRLSLGNTRTSVLSMFKTTKDNLLLLEKAKGYQQQIECLKLKIIELQMQIERIQKREKRCLKQHRKTLKETDQFKKQYEKATNFSINL